MKKLVTAAVLSGLLLPLAASAQQQPATAAATPATAAPAAAATSATPAAGSTTAAQSGTAPATTAPAAPARRGGALSQGGGGTSRRAPSDWRGTLLFATVGARLDTFFPSIRSYPEGACNTGGGGVGTINPSVDQLSALGRSVDGQGGGCNAYNPTVDMSIALRPRFFINRRWQLRGGISFTYEFTNNDFTSTRNEPRLTDPFIQLWYHGIPAWHGIKLWVAPTLALPLSPESRARTTIATPGILMQVARGFEHVLGGSLAVIANVSYSHPFYQYTTGGLRSPITDPITGQPNPPQCWGGGSGCIGQGTGLGALTNVANSLSWSVILVQEWGHFSPGVFFSMSHNWSYAPAEAEGVERSSNNQNIRNSSAFFAWLDYNIAPWVTAEVGYSVSRFNVLDGDGTYGNPVWAPRFDTRVYTQAVFTLDKLYDAIFHAGEGGGGIIRVRNFARPSPFARF
jgi:hypothetical protein